MRALLIAGCVFAAGCAGGSNAVDGAAADLAPDDLLAFDLATPPPQPPPALPVTTQGGPTIHAMQLFTVVWAGDEALGAQIDQFHAAVLGSQYWTDALGEYGVGAGAARGVVVLPAPRPTALDDSSFTPLIQQLEQNGQLPALTADTVIDFVVGKDLKTYAGQTVADYCTTASGYHTEAFAAPFTPYLVELPCAPPQGLNSFQNLTWTDSHEMVEAASDPHPGSNPAWSNPWLGGLGEIGDLCNDIPVEVTFPLGDGGGALSYTVTKVYSGVTAMKGGGADPCYPPLPGPYYNVGVDPSNIVIQTDVNGHGSAKVKLIPFTYGTPFSMDWFIYTTPAATVTPSSGTSKPGDVVIVDITTDAGPQQGATWFTVLIRDPNKPTDYSQEWIASIDIQ